MAEILQKRPTFAQLLFSGKLFQTRTFDPKLDNIPISEITITPGTIYDKLLRNSARNEITYGQSPSGEFVVDSHIKEFPCGVVRTLELCRQPSTGNCAKCKITRCSRSS